VDLRDLPPLSPAVCFDVESRVKTVKELKIDMPFRREYHLGSMAELHGEESFASVGIVASKTGLLIFVDVDKAFEDCHFPHIARGDGLELFIDTRNLKQASSVHKYCHHFAILPKGDSQEITRFRMEDSHPLAKNLQVESTFKTRSYQMRILLPCETLHGFNLEESPNLGFEYILHRTGGTPQHHTLSSRRYKVASLPGLWSTIAISYL